MNSNEQMKDIVKESIHCCEHPFPHDFSQLPDIVWVKILSYLSLTDKSRVALTCQALKDAFEHPSLWYEAVIDLQCSKCFGQKSGESVKDHMCDGAHHPTTYLKLIERFGAYFQDLSVVLKFIRPDLRQDWMNVIRALNGTQLNRLQSLTLNVHYQPVEPCQADCLMELASMVTNSTCLHNFTLYQWPYSNKFKYTDIIDECCRNKKLAESLESLSLFWLGANQTTWAFLDNTRLPSREKIVNIVSHFGNLRSLRLRASMLSDALLAELPKPRRRTLERLGILINDRLRNPPRHLGRHDPGPGVSASAWQSLVERSPELFVDLTVVTKIAREDLGNLLMREIPLASMNYMRYSRCTAADFVSLTEDHFETLRKFVDFSDQSSTRRLDQQLIAMVTKCSHLNYFLYNGAIHADTVRKLAEHRGRHWYYFQVNEDSVITLAEDILLENDNDIVIGVRDDGSCYMVDHERMRRETEEERRQALTSLWSDVRESLGRHMWTPLTNKSVERMLIGDVSKMRMDYGEMVAGR